MPGGCGISFINALLVTDFPEPDSPTMASVSPCFKSKFTPRTACTRPAYVLKFIFKFLTSKMVSAIFHTSYLRSFGSSASRKPSPTALNAKIVNEMKIAGKIKRQGAVSIALFPSDAIVPQLACGCGTPKPI